MPLLARPADAHPQQHNVPGRSSTRCCRTQTVPPVQALPCFLRLHNQMTAPFGASPVCSCAEFELSRHNQQPLIFPRGVCGILKRCITCADTTATKASSLAQVAHAAPALYPSLSLCLFLCSLSLEREREGEGERES